MRLAVVAVGAGLRERERRRLADQLDGRVLLPVRARAVTVWLTPPLLVQVTVSPARIATRFGSKALSPVVDTSASSAYAGPPTASSAPTESALTSSSAPAPRAELERRSPVKCRTRVTRRDGPTLVGQVYAAYERVHDRDLLPVHRRRALRRFVRRDLRVARPFDRRGGRRLRRRRRRRTPSGRSPPRVARSTPALGDAGPRLADRDGARLRRAASPRACPTSSRWRCATPVTRSGWRDVHGAARASSTRAQQIELYSQLPRHRAAAADHHSGAELGLRPP